MPSTIFFFFFLILLFLSPLSFISSAPILSLDSFLSHQSHFDPHASNDTFLSLPSPLKKSLSHPPSPPNPQSSLLSLIISVPVFVNLIGSFPPDAHHLLSTFLSAALSSDRFHVIASSPHHLL